MSIVHTLRQKVFSSAGLTLADQALVSGSNFLVGLVLARKLGVKEYGFYALAWMGVLLMSALHQAFVVSPMLTLSPQHTHDTAAAKDRHTMALLLMQLGFSMAAAGFAALFIEVSHQLGVQWQFDQSVIGGVRALGAAAPLLIFTLTFQDFIRRYFFVNRKPGYALVSDSIAYPGQLVLVFSAGTWSTLDLVGVFWMMAGMFALATLPLAAVIRPGQWQRAELEAVLKAHWKFGKWLVVTAVMQFFSGNFFIIASASLLGASAAGAVRVAQNLMGVMNVVFLGLENVIPIQAARSYRSGGVSGMMAYLKTSTRNTGAAMIAILGVIALLAPWLLELAYGESFVQYASLLRAFCLLYVVIFFGYPLRYALRTLERTRPIFVAYVLSTSFSLVAAYPFVQYMGWFGVMAGLIITQLLMQGYYLWALRREIWA